MLSALAAAERAAYRLRGKPHEPDRFHVTLHHLGDHVDARPDIVDQVGAAMADCRAAPFDVEFDFVTSFGHGPRNKPFVLRGDAGLQDLLRFQQTLGDAMNRHGLGRWVDKRFTPHVTLLYDDLAVPEHPVQPLGWRAREVVLVDSLLGQHRHVLLARWTLQD